MRGISSSKSKYPFTGVAPARLRLKLVGLNLLGSRASFRSSFLLGYSFSGNAAGGYKAADLPGAPTDDFLLEEGALFKKRSASGGAGPLDNQNCPDFFKLPFFFKEGQSLCQDQNRQDKQNAFILLFQ
ncbi:hypothetical protein [Pontibacter beigongshangensis]|uniref:hypothetical protein n=1 Tax=Pontibacter beigongshangensis TaxID=2574733 RepID=UPI00164F1D2B|nr:hypothetical protein [Pontibacter beigongshangensis]